MRLTFLGTGSAMPTGERFQTGLLLEKPAGRDDDEAVAADDENAADDATTDEDPGDTAADDGGAGSDGDGDPDRLLVDCGSGVLHRLARTDVGYEGVGTVLLTHHHLDHVSDLLALLKARWLAGAGDLTVAGPAGTRDLLDGLLSVHDYLRDRVDLTVREVGPGSFSLAGFDVEAVEVRHSMYCLAYRFDGRLAFSGDTEAFDGLAAFADGAAVLVHDCSFPDEVDVSNHPTPSALGEALSGHEFGTVYLTHLYPHTDGTHREMLASVGRAYDGDVRFARDGLSVDV